MVNQYYRMLFFCNTWKINSQQFNGFSSLHSKSRMFLSSFFFFHDFYPGVGVCGFDLITLYDFQSEKVEEENNWTKREKDIERRNLSLEKNARHESRSYLITILCSKPCHNVINYCCDGRTVFLVCRVGVLLCFSLFVVRVKSGCSPNSDITNNTHTCISVDLCLVSCMVPRNSIAKPHTEYVILTTAIWYLLLLLPDAWCFLP